MRIIGLLHRQYKESAEPLSRWDTGWAVWTAYRNPSQPEDCPVYGWRYWKSGVAKIPELEDAHYLATLSLGSSYPKVVDYVWALPSERERKEIPDGWMPDADYDGIDSTDLYFVRNDAGDWDLYSISGKVPDVVHVVIANKRVKRPSNPSNDNVYYETGEPVYDDAGDYYGDYDMYDLNIEYPDVHKTDPGFSLSPSTFNFPNDETVDCIFVGELGYDMDVVCEILDARYDNDEECPEGQCNFVIVNEDGSFGLYTYYVASAYQHVEFKVPVYIKYIELSSGIVKETRIVFTVHGMSQVNFADPFVKYVRNLATRVGSTELVEILGGNFTTDMSVKLTMGNEWSRVIPSTDLIFSEEGPWQKIGFMMTPELAMKSDEAEICSVYSLRVGYGDDNGFVELAGTGDASMLMENNVGLIRYKFDSSNESEKQKASAGTAVTTNAQCFYTSTVDMVYDSTDTNGNSALNGGASGKFGKTMYLRIPADIDCTQIRYVKVKVKYNKRLDYLRGEQVLDGVRVTDGDIVWLASQLDGTDGLWVVRTGEWEGLSDVLGLADEAGQPPYDPCTNPERHPLPVDDNVFVDLGARVKGGVEFRCEQDVPEKYGSQTICGRTVNPGDRVLLANQSDGYNGLWEVTCGEWIYLGEVDDNGSTEYDASDEILYQNNIDFCACENNQNNPIFNIEYYYLNPACYLAKAVRKVKLICSLSASLVPNNKAVITDYSITVGADPDLIVDTTRTAGDPEVEDCVKEQDTFEQTRGVGSVEVSHGCGELGDIITSPSCGDICDCRRYYAIDSSYNVDTLASGFSMVFWQFGDGGWHMYAYVADRGSAAVSYYVYHLHVCGTALPRMVDENTDVYVLDERGLPTSKRTRDAWFVRHGGVLADGFGMYDSKWRFKVKVIEDGVERDAISHVLDAETLYQNWALHKPSFDAEGKLSDPGTLMLAHTEKVYDAETGEYYAVYDGMEHIYGFTLYNVAINKDRFCKIYNAAIRNCVCQDTWTGMGTDQCYDADGYEVDCNDLSSEGHAFITTDNGEAISLEKTCFDSHGKKVECD